MREFDLVVIGGGSAGLKAARTAARAGRSVALAEERELGGECFWAGCVPTKAMVRAAQVWHLVRDAARFGMEVKIESADFAAAMRYKDRAVREVAGDGPEDGGLASLGASYYPTHARFESGHEIRVGNEVVRGRQILIATGTTPGVPPIPGLREAGYITNREAVHLEALPRRIVVLGGGPIGLEFGQVFRRFGAEVTVIERSDRILPREDEAVSALAATYLRSEGIQILTGAEAKRVSHDSAGKKVHLRGTGAADQIACDEILVATGRNAATGGLDIEAARVEHNAGKVPVDRFLRTNVPHIWAAGDICGGYMFTHVASYEGKLVACNMFAERPEPFDDRVVPRCTFIDPEVASIGLSEREAREERADIDAHTFRIEHLDRAVLHGDPRGLVKLVTDARDGQILGAHIIGPDASSMIAEVAVCMRRHLPIAAIADTMHAYPSFPEAVEAAALSAPNYRGQVEGALGN
ncbi:MAG TPA: FAD-dependent oxidoreductase [Chthonomonadaceae bacterium]|nr:FAD-dependent oxidoreductase [Chthonomonadaceae bacterium]